MKRIFVVVMLLAGAFLSVPVRANDGSAAGKGGSMSLLKGEHRDIQMVRELVWIEIERESYFTTVDFEFLNHGPAQTVKMGFPESGGGEDLSERHREKSAFIHFATWVDGHMVAAKRGLTSRNSEGYDALWVKTVAFKRPQRRHIRVRYQSRVGRMASWFSEGGSRFVTYNFTGGNWRGDVRESTLIAILHCRPYSVKSVRFFERTFWSDSKTKRLSQLWKKAKPAIVRRRDNWFRYQWSNWPAEGEWSIEFTSPVPKINRKQSCRRSRPSRRARCCRALPC